MRKVTGYIGALIIVMALMGSILAGYALNINGQNATVNAYEKVTDVSGLYTHTDQKTYIDYNPASNYIGYSQNQDTYTNELDNYSYRMKKVTNATITIDAANDSMTMGNQTYSCRAPYFIHTAFFCDKFYIETDSNTGVVSYQAHNHTSASISENITITISGTTTRIQTSTIDDTFTDLKLNLVYYPFSDYDYIQHTARGQNNQFYTDSILVYLTNNDQVGSVGRNNATNTNFTTAGQSQYYMGTSTTGTLGINVSGGINQGGGVYLYNVNYNNAGGLIRPYGVYYPISVITDYTDVWHYTESNRVNNYPLPRVDGMTTSEETINVSDLSGITNYANLNQYGKSYPVRMGWAGTDGQYGATTITNIDYWMPYTWFLNNNSDDIPIINYKLSDILTAGANVPVGTTTIKIDLSSNNRVTYDLYMDNGVTNDFDLNLPCINTNNYITNTNANTSLWGNILDGVTNEFGKKHYALYDVASGIVEVYTYDGVKINTLTAETCYIVSSQIPSSFDYSKHIESRTTGLINGTPGNYDKNIWNGAAGNFNNPTASSNDYTTDINLTYYVSTSAQKYLDITKGFSINPNNSGLTWNNQYENGIINILFRAENVNGTYHNTIIVSGNGISIDYTGGHFSVDITDGIPATDIGKWRSIVLKIDLLNGTVSAIPVRTFNSYTNVQLDNTVIPVGNLTSATPTNSITWQGTTNSLTFNIYGTSVFLDTYDTVMVNPTLDITEYFTDLDGFYRLDMSNFSIYGDSMTVNGVTGTVTGNRITFDEDTFILKDVSVIYADGHAYFKDSYTTLDLGAITTNNVILNGVWYFETALLKGFHENKQIYEWDWSDFIFDNTQFCIFYIGLALIGLVVARRFCILSVIDYIVFVTSIIVALSIQVIA